jgi:N-acetylglucosaminyl-diphospho-decaprenol L-rhamnosyltransferase
MADPTLPLHAAPSCDPDTSVTVLLVTYNSAHRAKELGHSFQDFANVVVVDNASADHTAQALQRALPKAQVLINPQNRGFGAANNRALHEARTEFVLLVNPDCVIGRREVVQMLECARRYPDAAMIAPQLIDRKGHRDVSYNWSPIGWTGRTTHADGDTCVGFVSGACMLIRRDAMLRIDGFDEQFFLYYEDSDLCLRLTRECGPIIVCPDAKVTHLNRSSSAGRAKYKAEYLRGYHHIQSKFIFDRKHRQLEVSAARRWRYTMVAALETLLRVCVLDAARACRVWGRVMGSWRYPQDVRTRHRNQPAS